jgi:hypothetical protein
MESHKSKKKEEGVEEAELVLQKVLELDGPLTLLCPVTEPELPGAESSNSGSLLIGILGNSDLNLPWIGEQNHVTPLSRILL